MTAPLAAPILAITAQGSSRHALPDLQRNAGFNVVDILIGTMDHGLMKCCRVQVGHWPAPEHRTPALAQQASFLYLALYFVPNVLHRDAPLMRTLVVSPNPLFITPCLPWTV